MTTHTPPWNEERFETAKELWLKGESATAISKRLNAGLSRSAVLGKMHRAGLGREHKPPLQRAGSLRPQRASTSHFGAFFAGAQPVTAPIQLPPELRRPSADLIPLEALNAHTCKWPIGDPATDGFGFCGALKDLDVVYCPEHEKLAVEPQTKEQRRATAKLYAFLSRGAA